MLFVLALSGRASTLDLTQLEKMACSPTPDRTFQNNFIYRSIVTASMISGRKQKNGTKRDLLVDNAGHLAQLVPV